MTPVAEVPVNSIFSVIGLEGYFMVTAPARPYFRRMSYPTITCNKNGRPFKKVNGHDAEELAKAVAGTSKHYKLVRLGGEAGESAYHPNSVKDGVKNRRVLYLRGEIASMQRELAKLISEGYGTEP